jgi:hypothetical protein
VTSGATVDCPPTPNAPAAVEYESRFPGAAFVTVSTQVALIAGLPVTTTVSVIVVAPVTVPVLSRVTRVASVAPHALRASVALEAKPPPFTVIGYEPSTKGTADGLISLISLPVTVKRAADVDVPPSGLVTVKVYVPGVADELLTKFSGVTEVVSDVDGKAVVPPVPPVTVTPVNFVPSTVLARNTTGVPTKDPVRVTVTAAFPAVSAIVAGVAAETDGGAFTLNTPASVPVPLLSVTVMGYEPGVAAEVDAK